MVDGNGGVVRQRIKVYGADWCGDCRRTRKLLEANQVDYDYLDIEADPKFKRAAVKVSGSKSIPVVVLPDTTVLAEPSDEELAQKLGLDVSSAPQPYRPSGPEVIYDVAILGGGPAGVAAGVYCGRKKLETVFITESFGGQSVVSADIQNWVGEKHISGFDLATKLLDHLKVFADVIDIVEGEKATSVKEIDCQKAGSSLPERGGDRVGDGLFFKDDHRRCDFEIATEKGRHFKAKALILATGSRRRRLGVAGEDKFDGKGVAFCSTCDAPLFKGKAVAVVGGGNAGLEAVVDLLPYAAKIYLLEFGEALRGDAVTQDQIRKNKKVEILLSVQVLAVLGDDFLNGLNYLDRTGGRENVLPVQGVFVAVGSVPNSEIVKGLLELDKHGQVVIDAFHASTSHPGIFAAGDVTNDPYKQNNIAAGDGVRAALACYNYLQDRRKVSPAEE